MSRPRALCASWKTRAFTSVLVPSSKRSSMRSLQIFTIKKMGRCLVLCLLFLTAGMPGWAQLGLSPLGMDASYPLAAWSPAQKIDTGLVIALPTVYASAYHTGPSLWSTVQRERGRTFIDVNDWVGH